MIDPKNVPAYVGSELDDVVGVGVRGIRRIPRGPTSEDVDAAIADRRAPTARSRPCHRRRCRRCRRSFDQSRPTPARRSRSTERSPREIRPTRRRHRPAARRASRSRCLTCHRRSDPRRHRPTRQNARWTDPSRRRQDLQVEVRDRRPAETTALRFPAASTRRDREIVVVLDDAGLVRRCRRSRPAPTGAPV